MPIITTDVRPAASLEVYGVGAGDPIIQKPWWGWYDILTQTGETGEYSRTQSGTSQLELNAEVGITCRPFLVFQDTRKSQYNLQPAGQASPWDEAQADTGVDRHYRLKQESSGPGTVWSAESKFNLPENAHFAFSVELADVPADHTGEVPRVAFVWGEGEWAIEFHPDEGIRLMHWSAKDQKWSAVADIPSGGPPPGVKRRDFKETVVWVRHHRKSILVSTNWGASYKRYGNPDGTDAKTKAGKLTFRGFGRAASFGFHQIAYYAGSYTSAERPMFHAREDEPCLSWLRGHEPYGTKIDYENAAAIEEKGSTAARYYLGLQPKTATTSAPFPFHYSPEVHAVALTYPLIAVETGPPPAPTTPWDDRILSAGVSLPGERDQDAATVTFRQSGVFAWAENWKWRKMRVLLGSQTAQGPALQEVFTGYLRTMAVQQNASEPGYHDVNLTLDNATIRAKSQEWDDNTIPLGGRTVNEALDVVLEACGLQPGDSTRIWHPDGDLFELPEGKPEDPFLWPRSGGSKWDTLTELAKFGNLEIGVDTDGVWYTVPRGQAGGEPLHTWKAVPASSLTERIERLEYTFNSAETFTGIMIRGTDVEGKAIWAGILTGVESDPASPLFSPWPSVWTDSVPGTTTTAMLSQYALAAYPDKLLLRFEVEPLQGHPLLGLQRGDRVKVEGSAVGIEEGDEFRVVSIEHTWQADPGYGSLSTVVGLRRLD